MSYYIGMIFILLIISHPDHIIDILSLLFLIGLPILYRKLATYLKFENDFITQTSTILNFSCLLLSYFKLESLNLHDTIVSIIVSNFLSLYINVLYHSISLTLILYILYFTVGELVLSNKTFLEAKDILLKNRTVTVSKNNFTIITNRKDDSLSIVTLNRIAPLFCKGIKINNLIYNEDCSCCLNNLDYEKLNRVLPCGHAFHQSCIDTWLLNWSSICPVCKFNLINYENINFNINF